MRTTEITPETIEAINSELERAGRKHGDHKLNSFHEGKSIIEEEFDELWADIKNDKPVDSIRIEAVQLAAMAIRFIQELT